MKFSLEFLSFLSFPFVFATANKQLARLRTTKSVAGDAMLRNSEAVETTFATHTCFIRNVFIPDTPKFILSNKKYDGVGKEFIREEKTFSVSPLSISTLDIKTKLSIIFKEEIENDRRLNAMEEKSLKMKEDEDEKWNETVLVLFDTIGQVYYFILIYYIGKILRFF
jgi:hypothetical protein